MSYVAGYVSPPPAATDAVTAHQFLLSDGSGNLANYPSVLRIMRSGRVGLGPDTTTPDCWLQAGQGPGTIALDALGGTFNPGIQPASVAQAPGGGACIGFNAVRQATYDGAFRLLPRNGENGGAVIWAGTNGTLNFSTIPSSGNSTYNATNYATSADVGSTAAYCRLRINPDGKVQIGRALSSSSSHYPTYKLAVEGKVVAQSVYVLDPVNWPDFVFEPGYRLLPLPELERYLQANKHLPTVPSAREVQANGVDLGAMQAHLLQQVEELTLRVIELAKQNERLQAEVTKLTADK